MSFVFVIDKYSIETYKVLVIIAVQYPASAGILPSISGIPASFPSLTDITGKEPMVSYDTSDDQVLSAVLQRGIYNMVFSYDAKDGTVVLTYPAVDSTYFDDIVCTSRITGQEITAEPGYVKGYAITHHNNTENLLPYPVDWSQGKLSQIDKDIDGNGNSFYQFQADSRDETLKLMTEYISMLEQMGFACRKDIRSEKSIYYFLSMDNRQEIHLTLLERENDEKISFMITSEYSFNIKEDVVSDEYWYNTKYSINEDRKEEYHVYINDNSFKLCFSSTAYHERDSFSLQDFLNQSYSGPYSSLYYCTFNTYDDAADGDGTFSTLEKTGYQKGNSAFFKDLTVEVLRKNASETVLYFYAEIDAGAGSLYKFDGLIDECHEKPKTDNSSHEKGNTSDSKIAVSAEQLMQIGNASQETDSSSHVLKNCSHCGGKGYDRCPKCSGTGKSRCTKCGGDGKSYSTVTKTEKKCTRCFGRGKQDCTSCTNGKRYCGFCNGTGHE